VWIGEDDGVDSWLLAPSSSQAIDKVRDGKIEIRQPFVATKPGEVYKLSVLGPTTAVVKKFSASALTEEMLPAKGERILRSSSSPSFFKSILAAAAAIMSVLTFSTFMQGFLVSQLPSLDRIRFLIDGLEAVVAAVAVWAVGALHIVEVFTFLFRDVFEAKAHRRKR
jgi:hypothetical protein